MKNTGEGLENFAGWDDLAAEDDFFSTIDNSGTEPPTGEESIETEDPSEDPETEEEEETPEDLFSMTETEEEEDSEEEEEEGGEEEDSEEEEEVSDSINALRALKSKGILDFELEEGEELTAEKAEELLEDSYEESVEGKVKELFEDLPEPLKQLNQFVIKGGSMQEFLSSIIGKGESSLKEDLDIQEESNQELVMKEMLKLEDYDSEYIEAQIKFLKDSGMLAKTAEKKFTKWKANKLEQQSQLLKQREIQVAEQKKAVRAAKEEVTQTLKSSPELGDIKASKEDIKALPSYMNDKSVKLPNGAVITELERDLFYGIRENKTAFLQLATLMRNRNDDGTFNFEEIVKNVKTKVTKEIKDGVRRTKKGSPTTSKSNKRSGSNKSLADYFN